jgi:hypothetical protein
MEAMSMSSVDGSGDRGIPPLNPRGKAERENLIDEILAVRSEWGGTGVGAYGADVCALCGAIDTFRGWIKAAYGTFYGPQGELVCSRCWHSIVPEGVSGMSEQHRLIGAVLSESTIRYCRLCQTQVERHPDWGASSDPIPRLCEPCLEDLSRLGITRREAIGELLRKRRRRRYLELLDDEELGWMADEVEMMRQELNTMRLEQREEEGDSGPPQSGFWAKVRPRARGSPRGR